MDSANPNVFPLKINLPLRHSMLPTDACAKRNHLTTLDIKNKDMGSRALDADILDIDQLKKEYEYQLEGTLMQRYFKSYQVSIEGHKGYSL
jgi:hypothetical protein